MKKYFYPLIFFSLFLGACGQQTPFELTIITQKLGKKSPNEIIELNVPLSSQNCEKMEFITDKEKATMIRIDLAKPFEFLYKENFNQMKSQVITEVNARNQMNDLELPEEFNTDNQAISQDSVGNFLNKIKNKIVLVYNAELGTNTINLSGQNYPVFAKKDDLKKALSDSLCANGADKKYIVLYNLELVGNTSNVVEIPKVEENKPKTTEKPKNVSGNPPTNNSGTSEVSLVVDMPDNNFRCTDPINQIKEAFDRLNENYGNTERVNCIIGKIEGFLASNARIIDANASKSNGDSVDDFLAALRSNISKQKVSVAEIVTKNDHNKITKLKVKWENR